MTAFISYSKENLDQVDLLRRDIEELHGSVWIDKRLSGGQDWWEEILSQITASELFVLALSPASLRSEACLAETNYAIDSDRPFVPVMVAHVDLETAPLFVAHRQVVGFVERTADNALALARALAAVGPAPPPPEHAPEAPPIPESYSEPYRRQMAVPRMDMDEQMRLMTILKVDAQDPDRREDAIELLEQLKARRDIGLVVAQEIDGVLGNSAPIAESVPVDAATRDATVEVTSSEARLVVFNIDSGGQTYILSLQLGRLLGDRLKLDGVEVIVRFTRDRVLADEPHWKFWTDFGPKDNSFKARFAWHQAKEGTLLGWVLTVDGTVLSQQGEDEPEDLVSRMWSI